MEKAKPKKILSLFDGEVESVTIVIIPAELSIEILTTEIKDLNPEHIKFTNEHRKKRYFFRKY